MFRMEWIEYEYKYVAHTKNKPLLKNMFVIRVKNEQVNEQNYNACNKKGLSRKKRLCKII